MHSCYCKSSSRKTHANFSLQSMVLQELCRSSQHTYADAEMLLQDHHHQHKQAFSLPITLLQEQCCNSQHTYAHAQLLLQEVGQSPQGARFKRLSQDMEVYAAEKLGHPIAWKMHQ